MIAATCSWAEWQRDGAALAKYVDAVRLTTWPDVEVEGVDAEGRATMTRGVAAAIISSELTRLYPGVEFDMTKLLNRT
jgi:hypothetical protein